MGYWPRNARLLSGTSGELLSASQLSRIDAVDEQVGVVTRFADVGQHLAVGRVDGDQCAAIFAEGLHRDFLQLCVQRQRQVLAGLRRGTRQHAHRTTAGIHFDLLESGHAVHGSFS